MTAHLVFPSVLSALAAANQIHANLIATNPDYAASVAAGQTTCWQTPAALSVWVKTRCLPVLTQPQIDALVIDNPN